VGLFNNTTKQVGTVAQQQEVGGGHVRQVCPVGPYRPGPSDAGVTCRAVPCLIPIRRVHQVGPVRCRCGTNQKGGSGTRQPDVPACQTAGRARAPYTWAPARQPRWDWCRVVA
jgi:hypothetical protein